VTRAAAPAPRARDVAARVLARVEKDQAFAAAALEAELARTVQLQPRDRALATELVYGSLRVEPWLLEQIGRHAPRGLDSIDARVRSQLVVAAYQLYFTRVPAFAAVNEAVIAVRELRGARLAAFANAVLRKVALHAESVGLQARTPTLVHGTSAGASLRVDAVVASTPAWLRTALDRALSPEGARAFLASSVEPPPVALRVERDGERDAWLARLRAAAPEATFEPGRASPRAILARGAGKPTALPGWAEGAWTVQEEGSQLAALAVGARAGETVLDACAGRGNKTGVLARAVTPGGAVDVCDASPSKLERLTEELARIALRARAAYAVDWSVGSGEVTGTYDRVLVDAPCTGVGTLRRRPEIGLRREAIDLPAKTATQISIASRAAQRVRPGGALLYVVCSVLREEAEDVVDAVVRADPALAPAPFETPAAAAMAGGATSFRLLPHVHGTDGYFVAMLRRR
jgi:16S rRNA (cytosine967-C5)-methyltransferase